MKIQIYKVEDVKKVEVQTGHISIKKISASAPVGVGA